MHNSRIYELLYQVSFSRDTAWVARVRAHGEPERNFYTEGTSLYCDVTCLLERLRVSYLLPHFHFAICDQYGGRRLMEEVERSRIILF